MTGYDNYSWELPSYAEANRKRFDPATTDGVDGYFQVSDIDPPAKSPFPKKDQKTKEPIYLKDSDGNFLLDENGMKQFDFVVQTQVTWECLELEGHPEMTGSTFKQFYTFSNNEKAELYKVLKAIKGGQVDPSIRPMPSDYLGGIVKGTIGFGEPKVDGTRWPKVTGPRAARGYTPPVKAEETVDEVPF